MSSPESLLVATPTEGAFSIVTRDAKWTTFQMDFAKRWRNDLRDHMLRTIHPDVDLTVLGKSNAGRAAHYLLDIINAPLTEPVFSQYDKRGSWRWLQTYEARRQFHSAQAAAGLFEGHPGNGITFIDPEQIIDRIHGLTTPGTANFIATYTKAVIDFK